MHFATIFSVASAIAITAIQAQTTTNPITGIRGNATATENNPEGAVFIARLPDKEFHNPSDPRGNVKGLILATAGPDGKGVIYTVSFSNLPTSGGPFLYHVHAAPVPGDANCTGTLGHLDPFIRGETPGCDASLPQTCQVGDLSGKHGKIVSDPFSVTYVDPFTSTLEGLGSFIGNLSFVIHFANKTRITCANFEAVGGNSCPTSTGYNSNSPTASNYYSAPTATYAPGSTSSPPAVFTGAATHLTDSLLVLLGAAGFALLLL